MIDPANVGVLLLAAGRSHRFGSVDKLLVPLDGLPLGLHLARRIVELKPAYKIAVCNDAAGDIACGLRAVGFEVVINPAPDAGLSQSLARGIERIARTPASAALICLADMPFVGVTHLRALFARFDRETAPVVASADGEASTPPAIFAREKFEELRKTTGDQGGRALLAEAIGVPASPGELADIDYPEDIALRR